EFVLQQRLQRAVKLLTKADFLPFKEFAIMCGFELAVGEVEGVAIDDEAAGVGQIRQRHGLTFASYRSLPMLAYMPVVRN
ncbi:hypothetical protein AB9E13_35350, partial [Rhizobium leguminosarum]